MTEPPFEGGWIGGVTVTYFPDLAQLEAQGAVLPPAAAWVLVDNGSPAEAVAALERLCGNRQRTLLLRNACNRGLAAALNQGVAALHACWPEVSHVLLLDQDCLPEPGSVARLDATYRALRDSEYPVGAVGPLLIDADSSVSHGFHQQRGWCWHRYYPTAGDRDPVPCHNLNGSGTYLRVEDFLRWGGLDEALFIDHLDTEWSFRLLSRGVTLWGAPQAVFRHSMGRATRRLWLFGWRPWPSRSPLRHYYLYRNTLHLLRRGPATGVWRFWATVRLVFNYLLQYLAGAEGRAQRSAMRRGLTDGWRARLGPAPPLKP